MSRALEATYVAPGVFTIEGALSARECDDSIDNAERVGFGEAPIIIGRGRTALVPEQRNNTRVMLDDWDLAAALFERVRVALPATIEGAWRLAGFNERFRYYRYEPGQYFRWHYDGAFCRRNGDRSFLSALFYLSDDFEGGATGFDFFDDQATARPPKGSLLVFDHHIRHQGAPVTRGVKYIARTDVMYRHEDA